MMILVSMVKSSDHGDCSGVDDGGNDDGCDKESKNCDDGDKIRGFLSRESCD